MKVQKCPLSPLELMKLATSARVLVLQAWDEPRPYRIVGRLARDPADPGALCEATIEIVKVGDSLSLEITKEPKEWLLLQLFLALSSFAMREKIWNAAHSGGFGPEGDEEEFELVSIWRKEVLTMIAECHQEGILAMTAEEYFAKLTETPGNESIAKKLVLWISNIRSEPPPVYLSSHEEQIKNENPTTH